jgi:DNA-binding IclR family transcriptional regulator
MPGEQARFGIKSVEVAARILVAMTQAGQPSPLKEIARLAGMSAGKVHRYLVSLTRTGLTVQDGSTGYYGIGPAAIALGLAGLRSVDIIHCASEFLPKLRDETQETAVLSVWNPVGPVIVHLEESGRPVFMNVRVGSVLPMLRTAVGLIFGGYLRSSATEQLIATELKTLRRGKAAVAWSTPVLKKKFEETLAHGFASITGDLVPGVNAIAAPVFDHQGRIAGSIALLGRPEDLDVSPTARTAKLLKGCAFEMSRRLGFNP